MQDFNNPLFICVCAKDFLEKSSLGAKQAYLNPEILDVQIQGQLTSLGKLPFPMVTAAFSLELALKGLLKQYGHHVPYKHHLKDLYDLLPGEVRARIADHYKIYQGFKGYPNFYLKVGNKDNPIPPNVLPHKDTIEEHIDALLARHAEAFQDFRYLFEFGITKQELPMDYNYLASFAYSAISILAADVGFAVE